MRILFLCFSLLVLGLVGCKSTEEASENKHSIHFSSSSEVAGNCAATPYADFQEAFRAGDFARAGEVAASEEEQKLTEIGEYVLWEPVSDPPRPVMDYRFGDSLWLAHYYDLYQARAWSQDAFGFLLRIQRMDERTKPSDLIMSEALASVEGEQEILFPDGPMTMPITTSSSGSPVVEVTVNGKKYNFWIDTGAGFSVVSSQVAKEVGIKPIGAEDVEIGTSTKRTVSSQTAVIDSLEIGDLRVNRHPCIILAKKDLTFRILGIRILKIDGIIGWPLIKELDFEIDLPGKELTIRKPVLGDKMAWSGDLGWYWQPILRMRTPSGCPLLFHLDTGAASTFFRPKAYDKLGKEPEKGGPLILGGAGGKEVVRYDKLDTVNFVMGEHLVQMDYAEGIPNTSKEKLLFEWDGVLGQDVLKYGSLRLDFQNRRFAFRLGEEK